MTDDVATARPLHHQADSVPIVTLCGVTKSYRDARSRSEHRTVVLDGVDLEIMPGQKASLIGRSGSGKSTLLSLVAGLLTPDAGTISIDGSAVSDLDDRRRARLRAERIGIALQADNLIPFLTALENVILAGSFGSRHRRRPSRARALATLARFDVEHCAARLPRHLSGGEAQRVALAAAVINGPALLLADEVVASLDGDTAGRVLAEVLREEFAVLFVTHDLAIADQVPNRYELVDGRIRVLAVGS